MRVTFPSIVHSDTQPAELQRSARRATAIPFGDCPRRSPKSEPPAARSTRANRWCAPATMGCCRPAPFNARCANRSSAKSAKKAPRYYRCRTVGCSSGQVAASLAERQALEALRRPDRRLPQRTIERMSLHASVWHHYWPRFRHLALVEVFTVLTWRPRTKRLLTKGGDEAPGPPR